MTALDSRPSHPALNSTGRIRAYEAVRAREGATATEVAADLGLSPEGIAHMLDRLAIAGLLHRRDHPMFRRVCFYTQPPPPERWLHDILPERTREVYTALRQQPHGASSRQLATALGLTAESVNNHLRLLRDAKLADGDRDGFHLRWRAAEAHLAAEAATRDGGGARGHPSSYRLPDQPPPEPPVRETPPPPSVPAPVVAPPSPPPPAPLPGRATITAAKPLLEALHRMDPLFGDTMEERVDFALRTFIINHRHAMQEAP